MDKRTRQKIVGLHKFLLYVLSRRPDEFGLFLDQDGSLEIKELLQALHEEPDWRYVRRSHLLDIFLVDPSPGFEVGESRIRITEPSLVSVPVVYPPADPPKVLYHGVRRRAYPALLQHGLRPTNRPYAPLAVTREMALRIGRRRDPEPVVVEVRALEAGERGAAFWRVHELLFLTDGVVPEWLSGPPLPKEPEKAEPKKPKPQPQVQPAGSFYLDPALAGFGEGKSREEKKERKERQKKKHKERKAARKLKRSD